MFMKVNLKMVVQMDKGNYLSMKEDGMMDLGQMIYVKDLEMKHGVMAKYTLVNILEVKNMVKGNINGLMDPDI